MDLFVFHFTHAITSLKILLGYSINCYQCPVLDPCFYNRELGKSIECKMDLCISYTIGKVHYQNIIWNTGENVKKTNVLIWSDTHNFWAFRFWNCSLLWRGNLWHENPKIRWTQILGTICPFLVRYCRSHCRIPPTYKHIFWEQFAHFWYSTVDLTVSL